MDLTGLSDHHFAERLAWMTGARLRQLRAERAESLTAQELGREGDAWGQAFIADQLARHRPGDGLLSEEAPDDLTRLSEDRVWIVDPLDGTREFGRAETPDWAVHIALWEADAGITAAAVAVPDLNRVHSTATASTASRTTTSRPSLLVSASRPPEAATEVATTLGMTVTRMGSAGAKTAAVIRGEADAYLHAGGQWEWDSAAPAGIALAAGLHASRTDGSPLIYNRADPYLPDLLICHPEHAEPILSCLNG